MHRTLIALYALFAYGAFLASFGYLSGFVAGWGVPKAIDDGPHLPPLLAAAIDLGLISFFGLTHSVMANPHFKRLWTRVVPLSAERSTYVLVASAQLALLCWQWRPVTLELWKATGAVAVSLYALQAAGSGIALVSTFLIDHWALFGLRQGLGGEEPKPVLRTPLLYRWVRHPLYFGMLLAFWSAPTMSVGHLLFAGLFTLYVVIGAHHEERNLVRVLGDDYRRYQRAVPMLFPLPRRAAARLAEVSPAN